MSFFRWDNVLGGIMEVLSRTSVITIQQTASRYLSVEGTRVETL